MKSSEETRNLSEQGLKDTWFTSEEYFSVKMVKLLISKKHIYCLRLAKLPFIEILLNIRKTTFFSPLNPDISKRWTKLAVMKSARMFASSIVLNNGRIWILGGLGVDSILASTELLEEDDNGIWKVHRGPDLPKPLFGHCVESIQDGKIILVGGFSDNGQTTSSYEFIWDSSEAFTGKWVTKTWSSINMERYDHICYSINGMVQVMGGWQENIKLKLKSEQYNETVMKWEDSDLELNEIDIMRSAKVGFSDAKLALIGGVSCNVTDDFKHGKNCTKPFEVYELDLSQGSDPKWKKSDNLIGVPRSSHAVVVVPTSIDFKCRVY